MATRLAIVLLIGLWPARLGAALAAAPSGAGAQANYALRLELRFIPLNERDGLFVVTLSNRGRKPVSVYRILGLYSSLDPKWQDARGKRVDLWRPGWGIDPAIFSGAIGPLKPGEKIRSDFEWSEEFRPLPRNWPFVWMRLQYTTSIAALYAKRWHQRLEPMDVYSNWVEVRFIRPPTRSHHVASLTPRMRSRP